MALRLHMAEAKLCTNLRPNCDAPALGCVQLCMWQCGFAGVRVGEAAHPGPSGAGFDDPEADDFGGDEWDDILAAEGPVASDDDPFGFALDVNRSRDSVGVFLRGREIS